MNPLTTSLAEIRSFHPCTEGWKDILSYRNSIAIAAGKAEADMQETFPLASCLESNSVSDVLWLIGKRKVEIQIAVRFARMCADSVAHLKHGYAVASASATNASASASDSATNAYAYADAAYAHATYAAAHAAAAVAKAATQAWEHAYQAQKDKTKQLLIQCINEFPFHPSSK